MDLMNYILIAFKVIVGISILNVWLLQLNKPTRWRGGDAKTIVDEFKVYGFSKNFCYLIGFLKVSLALILIASIQLETLTLTGSLGLTVLLIGSIVMHIIVKDPLYKSFPAFLFIVMNVIIAYSTL